MAATIAVISSRQSGSMGYCSPAFASRQKDIAEVRDSSADGEDTIPDGWDDHADVVAVGQAWAQGSLTSVRLSHRLEEPRAPSLTVFV